MPAGTLVLALVVAGLAICSGTARAACLVSSARCQGSTVFPTGPTYSITCEDDLLEVSVVDFNVPKGTFDTWSDEAPGAELYLNDEFTLSGPPAGTPVTFHVRVRAHGTLGGFGGPTGSHALLEIGALVPQPGDPPSASKSFDAPPGLSDVIAFSDSLDFTVTRPAGSPVGLQFHALAGTGGYDTSLIAQLVFLDLPSHATVTSCKGYSQDQPVPALARSWGSVKATYR